MPRSPRIVHPDLPHHVILRGNNRRRIFSYPTERDLFVWHLGRALAPSGCRLHALSLMSNHVHMVVTPDAPDSLARLVKPVAQRHAQQRNQLRGGSGKLFEQRYDSWSLPDDDALAVCSLYVDLNPLKGGLVADPIDFQWSTYSLHAGEPGRSKIPRDLWTPGEWYLALGSTVERRAAAFVEWERGARDRELPREQLSADEELHGTYRKRLERPDRSRARECALHYGVDGECAVVARSA